MCELERDVRPQFLRDEALRDPPVLVRDGPSPPVGIASPSSVVFASSPASFRRAQHGDALVERLAGDESPGAEPLGRGAGRVLQSFAVGRLQDRGARQRGHGGAEVARARREPTASGMARLTRSVQRRVGRHRREDAERAALAPEHVAPERVGIAREDVLGERGLDDPGALLELAVELSGPPARVPDVDPRARWSSPSAVRVDLGRQEPDRVEDERSRLAPGSRSPRGRRPQTAARGRRRGRCPISPARSASSGTASSTDGLGRAVEHDSERALVRVLADEHDRAPEVGIDEARPRDRGVGRAASPRSYHRRMEGVGREIRLVARPRGFPDEELFEIAESPIPEPADGQVLIRNAYFSVDPYMRPRMNDVRSYVAPFTLGEAMTGGAVGQVAVSRSPRHRRGRLGRARARLARVGALRRRPVFARSTRRRRPCRPLSACSGCPGSPRSTGSSRSAGRRRARRSSSPARPGAVGSAVGQMAKIAGCRVIGSAGSAEKVAWLRRARVRRRLRLPRATRREALAELAPDGIDIYFDNVGGDHLEAAIGALRTLRTRRRLRVDLALQRRRADAGTAQHVHGRHEAPAHAGLHHQRPRRSLRRVRAPATEWVRDGRLRYRETIVEGIENAPQRVPRPPPR